MLVHDSSVWNKLTDAKLRCCQIDVTKQDAGRTIANSRSGSRLVRTRQALRMRKNHGTLRKAVVSRTSAQWNPGRMARVLGFYCVLAIFPNAASYLNIGPLHPPLAESRCQAEPPATPTWKTATYLLHVLGVPLPLLPKWGFTYGPNHFQNGYTRRRE